MQDNTNENKHLIALRNDVLQQLVDLSDYFAADDDSSYDLLLALARNTGNAKLLDKAFDKVKAIEDPKQKSDGLLELLDEIEATITDLGDEAQNPVETSDEPVTQPGVEPDQLTPSNPTL